MFQTDQLDLRGLDLGKSDVIYLKFQRVNAAYYTSYLQNTSLKVWKPETPALLKNSAAYTRIAFLNYWVFDVIFSSIQLSQDFKVSNGRPHEQEYSS